MKGNREHKASVRIGVAATILVVAAMLYFYIDQYLQEGGFIWRWVALGPLIALIPNIILMYLLARSNSRRGSMYWFMTAVFINILWLLVTVAEFMANSPEISVFFYQIASLLWVPLGVILYFFVVTYVDDTDLPKSRTLFVGTMVGLFFLVFIGGASGLIEPNVASQTELKYWGYESKTSDTGLIVIAWIMMWFIAAEIILIKAYRRTKSLIKRRQLRLFIYGWAQYLAIGVIVDGILASVFYPVPFPLLTWLYSSTLSLMIGYGILKYGIFRISPVSLSNTILQSLSEAVLGINTELGVEFSNEGAEAILGKNQEALAGESLKELFKPDDFEKVQASIESNNKFIEFEDINVIDRNGKEIPVNLSIRRVFDEQRRPAGYIVVAANITELKRKTIELAEEKASVERKVVERTKQLGELQARMLASINSLTLGFIMTGEKNDILLINPAAKAILVMMAREQNLKTPDTWTITEVSKVFNAGLNINEHLTKTSAKSANLEFKEVQLGERYMHVFMAPVVEKSNLIGTVILFEDITEEKIVARSKDEFFSIASHELRTPLTSIRGSAELIHDYYKDSITNKDVLKMISDIQSSSSSLIQIVNDFLSMSELEQGKAVIIPEKFDFMKLLNEVLEKENKLYNKNVTTKITSTAKEIPMTADKTKVQQVSQVFFSNAIKFTDKGSVNIQVKPSGTSVTVTVTDTGKGIKPENQKLLFRKFQQAGSSLLTRDGGGTGLGLYITKLIMKLIGGEASLVSTAVGKGSTFSFTLPLVSKASASSVATVPAKSSTTDKK